MGSQVTSVIEPCPAAGYACIISKIALTCSSRRSRSSHAIHCYVSVRVYSENTKAVNTFIIV